MSNIADLRHPYKITYIATHRCQLRCAMCNIWRNPGDPELTFEQIDTFFRRSNRFSWINLSGGELVLRGDFLDIVDSIRRNCANVHLLNFPTNGYRPDLVVGAVTRILGDFRFPKLLVTVSLDGPPQVHDRIRSTQGSWDRAVETFMRLRAFRGRHFAVFLGMTLQDANAGRFDETFHAVRRRVRGLSYNDFHVNVMQRSAHYYRNLGPDGAEGSPHCGDQLRRILQLRRPSLGNPVSFLERRYQDLAAVFLRTRRTPVPCQALSASLFLDPAGTVYPCSVFDRPVGNIRDFDYDLAALWRSPKRRAIRDEVRGGNCPHCWTPCDAYPSMLASLLPGAGRAARNAHD